MKPLLAALILAGVLVQAASAAPSAFSFERYEVILTRMPFGEPPPTPPPAAVAPLPPGESFARALRLGMIIRDDSDGSLVVGIFDQQSNSSMRLRVGESENGIELVSADYDKEEAVLRKGDEVVMLKFSTGEPQAVVQPTAAPAASAALRPGRMPPGRGSWGRRGGEAPAAPAQVPAPPRLSGEELQKHLEEYKMQAIRQGMPPLPIPLTPEQDDQLVREGVLPPQP